MPSLYSAHSVDGQGLSEALRRDGRVSDHEVRFLRADGSEFWGRVSAHNLQYGGRSCLIAGVTDISDLRQAQAATEAASAAKTRFVSNMGHAMRTPLTDIIGYADLLVESTGEHAAAGTPDLSLASGRIRESGLALLGMIDTVLDHASLEAGALPMQIEPVALAGVVEEVCIAARPRTRHRGSSLSADAVADVQVLADRTRLKQLLLALVSQANRGGDRLTILLFVRPPADGWVEVKVRDNGAGLERRRTAACPRTLSQHARPHRARGGRRRSGPCARARPLRGHGRALRRRIGARSRLVLQRLPQSRVPDAPFPGGRAWPRSCWLRTTSSTATCCRAAWCGADTLSRWRSTARRRWPRRDRRLRPWC